MKYLIGFFFGLLVASAGAQGTNGSMGLVTLPIDQSSYLNAGVAPDNKQAPIRVDRNGYVICSTEIAK